MNFSNFNKMAVNWTQRRSPCVFSQLREWKLTASFLTFKKSSYWNKKQICRSAKHRFNAECVIFKAVNCPQPRIWPLLLRYSCSRNHALSPVYSSLEHNVAKKDTWTPILSVSIALYFANHDDVIKWKHFPCYWPFVRKIHQSQVNSPYKGQWRRVLMFSFICASINGWVSNREACDLRRHRAHYESLW